MWTNRIAARARVVVFTGTAVGTAAYFSKVQALERVPKFDPIKPRYDQSTFYGRYLAMIEVCDPLDAWNTEVDLEKAKTKIKAFFEGNSSASDEELWKAQKIVTSMTHPVTGEVTFWPGRMCTFLYTTVPIVLGMLVHGPTSMGATAFWQWANQSVNVCLNYVNRSGSEVDTKAIALSYVIAAGSSVGLALGATQLIASYPVLQSLGLIIPCCAVSIANTTNIAVSRYKEWTEGVPVFDKDGNSMGISSIAGKQAVMQTVVSRGLLVPAAVFLLPSFGMLFVRRLLPSLMKNRAPAVVMETGVIASTIFVTLPICLAAQPQTMCLRVDELEPHFENWLDQSGKPMTHFYANAGL